VTPVSPEELKSSTSSRWESRGSAKWVLFTFSKRFHSDCRWGTFS